MERLEKIARMADKMDVDAVLLTSEVNMQYATFYPRLEGMVVVDRDGCGICFTDSRYIEDASNQMTPRGYKVVEPEGSYPTADTIAAYFRQKGYQKVAYEDQRMTVAQLEVYRGSCSRVAWIPLKDRLERLRQIKEDEEIQWITQAQRIAERALRRLIPEIKAGAYEDELCAKLRYYMAMEGSSGFAPGMILVSGAATSMPHGQPSHKQIESGQFVTVDFGAEVKGYQSDMTRTFAVGKVTEKMRRVYEIVREAQQAGIDAFEAGKTGIEVDRAAREVIEKNGYGPYFGHGLGHSLGLEIHENPRASRTYEGEFATGNVLTIEPGIYIPGEFGVRIEDMIYLSETGKVNLTEFEKDLLILE